MSAKRKRRKRSDFDSDAERTPSGQKSRSKPRESAARIGLEARQRVYGLSSADAKDPRAGTVLGRLWLDSQITTPMVEAGERYLEFHNSAMRSIQGPNALGKSDGKPSPDWDSPEMDRESYTAHAVALIAKYQVMRAALADILADKSVGLVVIADLEPPENYKPSLIKGLKLLAEKMGV